MKKTMLYFWRDEPIKDIEQWAKDQGEKIVECTFKVKDVNPFARKAKNMITYYEEQEDMPESFLKNLRISDGRVLVRTVTREPVSH